MNEDLKQALIEAGSHIALTIGVTGFAFFTVKAMTKIYGPIEVKIKK